MTATLHVADPLSLTDLATFVSRARRLDPDGAARLSAHRQVLAVYVSPVHGAGAPDVLGLRTFALAEPSDADVVVPLAALADRLARPSSRTDLPLPPAPATGVSWAGVAPPRQDWAPRGHVDTVVLRDAARAGVAEVAAGAPDVAGAPAVARLRAAVWGRPLPVGPDLAPGTDVPAGAAFAADGLGFLDEGMVPVLAAGRWHRLSTPRGHVLTRRPLLG